MSAGLTFWLCICVSSMYLYEESGCALYVYVYAFVYRVRVCVCVICSECQSNPFHSPRTDFCEEEEGEEEEKEVGGESKNDEEIRRRNQNHLNKSNPFLLVHWVRNGWNFYKVRKTALLLMWEFGKTKVISGRGRKSKGAWEGGWRKMRDGRMCSNRSLHQKRK